MAPVVFLDDRVTLYVGDCLAQLALLPDCSVDCVVTSPPYWGLRDYGVEGQLGLEPTLAEHLAAMVAVFREIRRVLKPMGTLWINYGDCYATSPNGRTAAAAKATGKDDRTFRDKPFSTIGPVATGEGSKRSGRSQNKGNTASDGVRRNYAGQGFLKPKDLCMVPNRLAILLQEDGWWIRSEIIWGKTNPMPDSAKDRPGTSHEKIFLLTKSARYWYDAEAVRFDLRPKTLTVYGTTRPEVDDDGTGKVKKANFSKSMMERKPRSKVRAADVASPRHAGHINHTGIEGTPRGEGRNLRNYEPAPLEVWPMATKPFSEAHFATFPPELAERCILAGCPKDGLVLDPFGGAGTTALVALRHGRRAALIELNPDYAEMSRRRIEAEWRVKGRKPTAANVDHGPLFKEQCIV